MRRLFVLPDRPAVPIAGAEIAFPVRRIFCVGRNYAAHAREMGKDPGREPPFFFTKFAETLVPGGGELPYPPKTNNYQYEAELVIAIGKSGAALNPRPALDIIYGYAAGLDMTRRDLQLEARDKCRPWDMGKNFAYSAPIAAIRPAEGHGHIESGPIRLEVNGVIRQEADIRDLIWSCGEVIAYLSHLERLLPGDLIYTGTPAGVGSVEPGDCIEVAIEGLEPLHVVIGQREPAFDV
jgi:fumarylpyruvate hydrolase